MTFALLTERVSSYNEDDSVAHNGSSLVPVPSGAWGDVCSIQLAASAWSNPGRVHLGGLVPVCTPRVPADSRRVLCEGQIPVLMDIVRNRLQIRSSSTRARPRAG